MKTISLLAILSSCALWTSACETPKPADSASARAEKTESEPLKSAALSEAQITQLIARAEASRDRALQTRPTFLAVEKLEKPTRSQTPERQLLSDALFGFGDLPNQIDPRQPYAALARYERSANRIVYVTAHKDEKEVELAMIAAIVSAIDAQNFVVAPEARSWDEALAQAVAGEATVLFALASDSLSDGHPEASLELLAKRPELVTTLPYLGDWMAFEDPANTAANRAKPGVLTRRVQRFITREAWQLAAALYRSNGWSGVELVGAMRPTRTTDIVRPDQWMRGAPVGKWTWPKDGDHSGAPRRGSVGPALLSIWLEDVVDARLTQSLYAGYLSDAYRYFEGSGEDDSPRFEWLTLWDSPSSASQVAAAFEQRLRKRWGRGEAASNGRYSVFAEGLVVGVIIEDGPDDEALRNTRRARAEHLLKAHKVELLPRPPLPLTFVPTRRDELAASASTLNERVWQGAASNLRIDLTSLGDGWRVQSPDAGSLRWFASHQDGALLQLSVELDNPLGPAFESAEYRTKVGDAIRTSLDDSSLEILRASESKSTGALDEPGLMLRVRGLLNKEERVLQIWQFHRGDLLVTYSLQSPPKSFEAHLENAATILAASTRVHRQTAAEVGKSDTPAAAPTGSIEYKIED